MLAVNAHTHLYSGLAPLGMPKPKAPPQTFLEILERVWWRLDRALDAESIKASADFYVAEASVFGCAGLIDHHESPSFIEGSLDVIADSCQAGGMPAVLTYGATERNGGREEAKRGLEECRRFIEENQRPLVRGLVGLHAGFTVSDETIAEAVDIARRLDVGLHLHVAEDAIDVKDAKEKGYSGIIDRLEKLGALISGSVFAHGVHLDRDEVAKCASANVWLVQNPRSNRGNQVGYPSSLAASPRVALGTDGFPSDMSVEAAALRVEAERARDDLLAADKRLAASQVLFEQISGLSLEDSPKPPEPAQMNEIRKRALAQAPRLWKQMNQF